MSASGRSRLKASAPAGSKNGFRISPCREEWRLMGAQVVLPLRIESDVRLVVAEEVRLQLRVAIEDRLIVSQRVRAHIGQAVFRYAVRVLKLRGFRTQKSAQSVAVLIRRHLPIGADRIPGGLQALFIGIAVL